MQIVHCLLLVDPHGAIEVCVFIAVGKAAAVGVNQRGANHPAVQ